MVISSIFMIVLVITIAKGWKLLIFWRQRIDVLTLSNVASVWVSLVFPVLRINFLTASDVTTPLTSLEFKNHPCHEDVFEFSKISAEKADSSCVFLGYFKSYSCLFFSQFYSFFSEYYFSFTKFSTHCLIRLRTRYQQGASGGCITQQSRFAR